MPHGRARAEVPDRRQKGTVLSGEELLASPLTRALATAPSPVWRQVRQRRRVGRFRGFVKQLNWSTKFFVFKQLSCS